MIPILNNAANFINGDGILTNQNANFLFRNKRIGKFNIKGGIIFNSNIDGINHIENHSSIIGITQSTNLFIDVPIIGDNKLEVYLIGGTFSYNYQNIETGKYVFLNSAKHTSGIDLSGIYKVEFIETTTDYRKITIEDISNSIVTSIPDNDFVVDIETSPNILTLSRTQFQNCYVKSGLYQRSNHVNNIFNSEILNIDLNNLQFLSKLRIYENILTSNEVQMATVQKSHILDTIWTNGLVFNSIWNNKKNFLNGTICNSFWISGTFSNGLFLKSNSMTLEKPEYSNLNLYRSWNSGNFLDGVFSDSKWLSGTFSNGNFVKSDWLSGLWINGILGDSLSNTNNTTFGNLINTTTIGNSYSVWENGIVDNSIVGGNSSITWKNGTFRSGLFTSNEGYSSIWENGVFNNGTFNGIAKWENGIFNNGLFSSFYGLGLHTSTQSIDYPWENGKFNGGVFGSGDYFTNSSWYYGEFNGGLFKGKVWNDGIFSGGEFLGGGTYSPTSEPNLYVSSFTQSFYGVWRNGIVTDSPLGLSLNRTLNSNDYRGNTSRFNARFKNILWLGGTFSHQSAILDESVWIDGSFNRGLLSKSSFNPYVDRRFFIPSITATHSFNLDTCIWRGGRLEDSDFYISEWLDGTFISGTMSGAIWKKGTWLYGNANNILWLGGRWRNGNWNGSPFGYTYLSNSGLLDDYSSQITKRINSYLDPLDEEFDKLHMNNVGYYNIPTFYNLMGFSFSPVVPFSDYYDVNIASPGVTWSFNMSFTAVYVELNSNSFSKPLTPQQHNCDMDGCSYSDNIFRDTTTGYRVSINANKLGSESILMLDIGGLTGPSTPVSPGQAGFDVNNKPYINLSNVSGTYSFIYYHREGNPKNFKVLAKNIGPTSSVVDINNIVINKVESLYDENYNNNIVLCNLSATASIPFGNTSSTPYIIAANEGNYISLNFGNGLFRSGIWENGVWNDGWRKDHTYMKVDNLVNFIMLEDYLYKITLTAQNFQDFNIGDRISVSNIIGIDFNGNDILIKSPFTVVHKTSNEIQLLLRLNIILRNIEIDSKNHNIGISKNVWLSGAFLNGYYSGILNYALVKGKPMITNLQNTQIIDCVFEGGRISNIDLDNVSLIQNFIFDDCSYFSPLDNSDPDKITLLSNKEFNILGAYNRRYLSWIDLEYDFNITSTIFNSSYTSIDVSTPQMVDSMARCTMDILRSRSKLRSLFNFDSLDLNLGSKYRKIKSLINNTTFNYETIGGTNVIDPNIDDFESNGWLFESVNDSFMITPQTSTYSSNFNINQTNIGDIDSLIVSVDGVGDNYGNLFLKNTTSIVDKNRYTMIEMEISDYSGDEYIDTFATAWPPGRFLYPKVYLNNKSTFYPVSPLQFTPTNHLLTDTPIKREFFYNRDDFGLLIFGGPMSSGSVFTTNLNTTVKFKYIKYYEVDYIPFYRYFSFAMGGSFEDRIDRYVKVPNRAIAPPITFSDDNLEFISNIRITTESIRSDIVVYPTSPPSSSPIDPEVPVVDI